MTQSGRYAGSALASTTTVHGGVEETKSRREIVPLGLGRDLLVGKADNANMSGCTTSSQTWQQVGTRLVLRSVIQFARTPYQPTTAACITSGGGGGGAGRRKMNEIENQHRGPAEVALTESLSCTVDFQLPSTVRILENAT